jgi:hypothetical protein
MTSKVSTYFALMAEFGTCSVPLARVCEKYFGLSVDEANRRAPKQKLPVPVFQVGSRKSEWLVSIEQLAKLLDSRIELSVKEWKLANAA